MFIRDRVSTQSTGVTGRSMWRRLLGRCPNTTLVRFAVAAATVPVTRLHCDADEEQRLQEATQKVYHRWRANATDAKEANAEGRVDDAERLFRAAINDAELFTSRDPRLASSLCNLAEFLRVLKRYEDAKPVYARGVACFEKALGRSHPLLGLAIHNQASFLVEFGELDSALPVFQRALMVKTKAFGEHHEECAKTHYHIGELYTQKQNFEQARDHLSKALAVVQEKEGVAAARACRWRLQLSLVLLHLNEASNAEALHVEACKAPPKQLLHVHEARFKFLVAAGKGEEATKALEAALALLPAGGAQQAAVFVRAASGIECNELSTDLLNRASTLVREGELTLGETDFLLKRIQIESRRLSHPSQPHSSSTAF
eukprot:TRINITY_DN1797_c0_g1_i1.p1 TRINITY_DN1797_c0_g1~~TRINITY_DN1797_c0_g1_i1.p1  ORF type:complete len:373 (-),score=62.04 TRINITY_DN1797_c0_g1_i1:111-1229(-)